MIDLFKALIVMKQAAIDAGRLLLKMQSKSSRLESRKDFLTDADLESERVILAMLTAEYPEIPSFSEEQGGIKSTEGYLWVIDPVDGTINFFLGDNHWGVSIALVENGRAIAGVVYLPANKQLFSASCDIPTKLQIIDSEDEEINLRVNSEVSLASSQFWFGWGKEERGGEDHRKVCEAIAKLDCQTLYPQIRNSATADMMMVAQGKIHGYVFLKPEPFDIAAAGLIIERAGGKVTDHNGNPWNVFSGSLIASNGILHDKLLSVISS
jgi:myo-inositol-1(or 4)-monophosphatase